MTIIVKQRSSPIADAYKALVDEEMMLTKRLAALQERQASLRKAIEAMKPLLPPARPIASPFFPAVPESQGEDEELEDSQAAGSPFAGMRFSQALLKFMVSLPQPMSTTEIAKQFEAAGWKFKSDLQAHKVNQVGVTMRRMKGKLFETTADGLWYALTADEQIEQS